MAKWIRQAAARPGRGANVNRGVMHLAGSCHCGAVRFRLESAHPYPFNPVHPLASAIDTPLPVPPERTHLPLDSKASWVQVRSDPREMLFPQFPEESIAEWHERLGLSDERPE